MQIAKKLMLFLLILNIWTGWSSKNKWNINSDNIGKLIQNRNIKFYEKYKNLIFILNCLWI